MAPGKLRIKDGIAEAPIDPGIGVTFDFDGALRGLEVTSNM